MDASAGPDAGQAPDKTPPGPLEDEASRGRFCWICGAAVVDRHCKIVCPRCGFMRDCSDP